MAQPDVPIDEDSLFVGSAMRDDVAHRLQHGLGNDLARPAGECYSVNAAHTVSITSPSVVRVQTQAPEVGMITVS